MSLYWKIQRAAHDICNLRCKIPKEIPVVFHKGSAYDYHSIIKELAQKIEGQYECLGENTGKCIIFSVPVKKEITKIDKNGNDKIMKISYKIKFIDSLLLCQPHYRILLIIYLMDFTVTSAQIVNLVLTI